MEAGFQGIQGLPIEVSSLWTQNALISITQRSTSNSGIRVLMTPTSRRVNCRGGGGGGGGGGAGHLNVHTAYFSVLTFTEENTTDHYRYLNISSLLLVFLDKEVF